jgi:hypothetical protein
MSLPPQPTTRDVFPRLDDRVVIRGFLSGKRVRRDTPNAIVTDLNNILVFKDGGTIAWYDTSGALCAKLAQGGRERPQSRLAINFIMDQMGGVGGPVRHVEREGVPDAAAVGLNQQRYFFDGAPVGVDQPIVLVGPLGVIAYRAALGPHAAFQQY